MPQSAHLAELVAAYERAPALFHATPYWSSYQDRLVRSVAQMDLGEIRSGKNAMLRPFGFGDTPYFYHPDLSPLKAWWRRQVHARILRSRNAFPYELRLPDIQETAFRHCELLGQVAAARPIGSIEVSRYGQPGDLFEVAGKPYCMRFLSYYVRYCFAQRHRPLRGDEVIVELGPGTGYQVEVLKKLYPDLTILCFDLPAQIYLCQEYLSHALDAREIVRTEQTLSWTGLQGLQKGHVHFFGNWQFPLVKDLAIDLFWNAASFGEMEPDVVRNYLGSVLGNAASIYLLQARRGKEAAGAKASTKARVREPVRFDDYKAMLAGYRLVAEQDAWHAHRRLSDSGGYFEALWSRGTVAAEAAPTGSGSRP
jgi:putative sugar O-methyltransferase